ncbi:MAG: glucuronate isomerase [Bacilli bacterium]|nr:glucuronate isomerase [Bacilli bacterium]
MSFINKDLLLSNETAKRLYFGFAKDMPIFDYHCHLSEKQILENKPFDNVCQIWLYGDHYKWRLMRAAGVSEEKITGNASDEEKFITYCSVLSKCFGNPLYQWSQVELETFFKCDLEINEKNAKEIYKRCNAYIKENNITPQKLIEESNVAALFTTNEVFDDLSTFGKIKEKGYKFKVAPAFRADKIMNIEATRYNEFIGWLEAIEGPIKTLDDLEKAILSRLKAFKEVGSTATDIALVSVQDIVSKEEAAKIFAKRRSGEELTEEEANQFKGYMTYFLMWNYAENDMATELHLGAMRNNSTRLFNRLGLDCGNDSISDENSTKKMARLFDALDKDKHLPKTIVFCLNPKMNEEIVTLINCFQEEGVFGKMQFGPAWWFLDQENGMREQLKALALNGNISTFVGMLTDSRSFLSYPRHQYFRRILCDYFGSMMESGRMTKDEAFVGEIVKDICYRNAVKYLLGE